MIDVLTDLMQKHDEEVYVIKELFKIHYTNSSLLEFDKSKIKKTIKDIMKNFKDIKYKADITKISFDHFKVEMFLIFGDIAHSFDFSIKLKNS